MSALEELSESAGTFFSTPAPRPSNAEIVHMHAVVYKQGPEIGAVVHTHSTYATSFALASRSLVCSYEALVPPETLHSSACKSQHFDRVAFVEPPSP